MKKIFYIILFFVCVSACTAPIDISKYSSSPTLCIYGVVTADTQFNFIELSVTSGYFDTTINRRISDAEVYLEGNVNFNEYYSNANKTSNIVNYFASKDEGYYISEKQYSAIEGETYTLHVICDVDGDSIKEEYTATTVMQRSVPFESLKIRHFDFAGKSYFAALLSFYEPKGSDYYLYRFFISDSLVSEKVSKMFVMDDALIDDKYVDEYGVYTFNDYLQYDDYSENDRDGRLFVKSGETVEFEGGTVEKSFHDFIMQCKMKQGGENPLFGGPAANIVTNVTNGGTGYFGAINTSKCSAKIP